MAKLTVEMVSNEQKLWQGFDRVTRQIEKMERGLKKSTRAADGFERSADRATGSKMLGQLKQLAAGWASVGGAVAAATALMTNANQKMAEVGSRTRAMTDLRAKLAQISGTPQRFQQLQAFAADLRGRGFSGEAALRTTFSAASAGDRFLDAELLDQLRRVKFNPESAISAVQISQANFHDAGPRRAVLNKIMAAATKSKVGNSELAAAVGRPASSFSAIGGRFPEILALQSVLTNAVGDEAQAATLIKSLSDQLFKKGKEGRINLAGSEHQGKGGLNLILALRDLEKQGRLLGTDGNAQSMVSFLGESGAISAEETVFKLKSEILALRDEVRAAPGQRLLFERSRLASTSPAVAAARQLERSTGKLQLLEEGALGARSSYIEAGMAELEAFYRQRGDGETTLAARRMLLGLGRVNPLVAGEIDERLEGYGRAGGVQAPKPTMMETLLRAILNELKRMRSGPTQQLDDLPMQDLSGAPNITARDMAGSLTAGAVSPRTLGREIAKGMREGGVGPGGE